MKRQILKEFNDIGEKITITVQLRYEDFELTKLPKNCDICPIRFMGYDCGKVMPFGDKRPETCKLKQVDLGKKLGLHKSNQSPLTHKQFLALPNGSKIKLEWIEKRSKKDEIYFGKISDGKIIWDDNLIDSRSYIAECIFYGWCKAYEV